MQVLLVIGPFLVLGIIVAFIAFSGSPGAAREAYLTRGGRFFTLAIVLLYLGLGVAVPAAVIAARGESEGAVGPLRTEKADKADELGKELFIANCKSCHNLDAVNAHGVTGPDLDELGGLDKQRVLNAIKRGGTGQGRMPAGLLEGKDAEAVASYVARVAGQ
ncbi:MAG: cytochrome [Thermoleophilaceae bacterium]|jgi:mono/diheme cytochrome c family protein|nr:cytochrome [Thermoleophilaceae bacterium]